MTDGVWHLFELGVHRTFDLDLDSGSVSLEVCAHVHWFSLTLRKIIRLCSTLQHLALFVVPTGAESCLDIKPMNRPLANWARWICTHCALHEI